MATVPDDILLGDKASMQGYRLRSFVRDSAPLISTKFSTGEQGQSDLDLLKVKTWKSFKGGGLNRVWDDDNRGLRCLGFYNQYNDNLYPAVPYTSLSVPNTYLGTNHSVTARVSNSNLTFVAHREGPGNQNRLQKITSAGVVTDIALPVAVGLSVANIDSLVLHKGYLFVCGTNPSVGMNVHRFNYLTSTWQDVGGVLRRMATLRGQLYGVNVLNQAFSVTNEEVAGTITYTLLKSFSFADAFTNNPKSITEFNGALWIAIPQGLYRFDGADVVRVLPMNVDAVTTYNGALYFMNDGWLYRFDGVNLERIQYFGDDELVSTYGLWAFSDYLCILTTVGASSKYSSSDASGTPNTRVYTYDGVGFNLVFEETMAQQYTCVTSVGSRLLICSVATGLFTYGYVSVDFSRRYKTTSGTSPYKIEATTSEFDDGFPNIFKSLEAVEVDYSNILSTDVITVAYQYYDGKTWSAWITLGTITYTTDNRIELVESGSIVKLAKAFKVRAVGVILGSTASNLSLKSITLRYTLQPRMRWRWQVGVIAQGFSQHTPIMDRLGAEVLGDANDFNNKIIKSIKSKTPIYLFSPDYAQLLATATSSDTTIYVKGQLPIYTDPYNEYPLIAVKNNSGVWEILRVASVLYDGIGDATTIVVKERGYLGITPAQLTFNTQFRLAYKVYITRLLRDAPVLDEITYNEQSTGESQLMREFMLELVEV